MKPTRFFLAAALALCAAASPAKPVIDYKELAKQVQIRRDEWGVPHILAPNDAGAALGMGYAQAEDYPDLLPRLFAVAKGDSAKHFGESYYNRDFQNKVLGFYDDSVARFESLSPRVQAMLDGYAAGYNLWLERFAGKKEAWMGPITGPQVLAHGRVVVLLEFTMRLNGFPGIPKNGGAPVESAELLDALRPAREMAFAQPDGRMLDEDLMGSNMWGIGGARTASGRGILLANPHLQWANSMIFYEAHVTIPGELNLSGSTLIGSPGVTMGFNDHLGWSHTVNRFDSHDVMEMEDDPAKPDHYIYDGMSMPYRRREISIEVLKKDGGTETKTKTVYDAHFGPVIGERGGKRYALKSPNLDNISMLEQWAAMGRAKSLREFKSALNYVSIPMFNIAYADREGNCFYIYNGRIPSRPDGQDWSGIVPGNTSKLDWTSPHPAHELPQILNPKGAYVQNCNDAPWYTNKQQLIDKSLFASYFCLDHLQWRSQLSIELLESTPKFTLDDVKKLKFTSRMMSAERMKDGLVAALEKSGGDADMKQAIDVLKAWDNKADYDSRGALLFQTWLIAYQGKTKNAYQQDWIENDAFNTPRGVGDDAVAVEVMKKTIAEMKETFGKLDPAWGEVHHLVRGAKRLPLSGGTGTLGFFRVISYGNYPKDEAKTPGERFAVGGDSYILAVEFTEPPVAWSVTAYSETERPDSPHFTDQSELFARKEMKRAWFTEEDVKAHAARTYHPGE